MSGMTDPRHALVDACRRMTACGITQGTSGNISLRDGPRMWISPSATPAETLAAADVPAMGIDAADGAWTGGRKPSTEWRFHRDILRARPDVGAVVHGHPTFCTALAIARRPIPPVHYMIAAFGGADIRCAPYATFGTAELSACAVRALEGRNACLLANHGMIACGPTLARAMWLAVELETLARQYWHSLLIGGPVLLTDAELADAVRQFDGYGQQA